MTIKRSVEEICTRNNRVIGGKTDMGTEILQDIRNTRRTAVAETAIEKYDETFVSKYKGCTLG